MYYIFIFQRACYLSLNPLKEESMESEKSQYTLPDGSSIEVIHIKNPNTHYQMEVL